MTPEENQDYILGVQPGIKSNFLSMFVGGFTTAQESYPFGSEKLDFPSDSNKLGGPVAILRQVAMLLKMEIENVSTSSHDFHQYWNFNLILSGFGWWKDCAQS